MAKIGKPSEPPKIADNKPAEDKAKKPPPPRDPTTMMTTTATSRHRSATATGRMTSRFEGWRVYA